MNDIKIPDTGVTMQNNRHPDIEPTQPILPAKEEQNGYGPEQEYDQHSTNFY